MSKSPLAYAKSELMKMVIGFSYAALTTQAEEIPPPDTPMRTGLYKTNILLYSLYMSDISISNARENFSTAVSDARKKPVRILKHGKLVAVLVNPSMFEKFVESMEELADISAFDEAISDKSPGVPWHQVKRDLGIA
jgi:PHD/YefM family antitoxin component YafN of YafNO toxin-antitoxin module